MLSNVCSVAYTNPHDSMYAFESALTNKHTREHPSLTRIRPAFSLPCKSSCDNRTDVAPSWTEAGRTVRHTDRHTHSATKRPLGDSSKGMRWI
jgi:hypothetical protein